MICVHFLRVDLFTQVTRIVNPTLKRFEQEKSKDEKELFDKSKPIFVIGKINNQCGMYNFGIGDGLG